MEEEREEKDLQAITEIEDERLRKVPDLWENSMS